MTDAQVQRCRQRLERFLVDLLAPIGRTERRHWSGVYVRSLLLNGERKSIEPLAARLPEGDVQATQQFIGQSPMPVMGTARSFGKNWRSVNWPTPSASPRQWASGCNHPS